VCKEQHHIYVAQTSNNRVISSVNHYCCLPPQCEALRLAAGLFRLQQNGAVTRMWRSCCVKPSQKECAIGAVRCKNEGMLLQPLRWCCVDCVIHHERDVREEQHHMYVVRTSNNRVIMACELYCCLPPQCEALCTSRSGFPIATVARIFEPYNPDILVTQTTASQRKMVMLGNGHKGLL